MVYHVGTYGDERLGVKQLLVVVMNSAIHPDNEARTEVDRRSLRDVE